MTVMADRSQEKRLLEMARRAADTGIPCLTNFLTPAELLMAEICGQKIGVRFASSGGIPRAERQLAAFFQDDPPPFPIACVEIAWNAKFGAIGHRDLLGSIVALGLEREKTGDILPGNGLAHAMVRAEIAPFVRDSLLRVANVPVRASIVPLPDGQPEASDAGEERRTTIASTRLDVVVAEAFRLSRSRAAECVEAGRVSVNFQQELRPDHRLAEGALLSVRGMGRVRLVQIHAKTRKNRIGVTFRID